MVSLRLTPDHVEFIKTGVLVIECTTKTSMKMRSKALYCSLSVPMCISNLGVYYKLDELFEMKLEASEFQAAMIDWGSKRPCIELSDRLDSF